MYQRIISSGLVNLFLCHPLLSLLTENLIRNIQNYIADRPTQEVICRIHRMGQDLWRYLQSQSWIEEPNSDHWIR